MDPKKFLVPTRRLVERIRLCFLLSSLLDMCVRFHNAAKNYETTDNNALEKIAWRDI